MPKKQLFLNLSLRKQSSAVIVEHRHWFGTMSGTEPGQTASNSESDALLPRLKKPRITGSFEFRKSVYQILLIIANKFYFRYAKRHIALRVAYLGWNYHGFAIQKTTPATIEVAINIPNKIRIKCIALCRHTCSKHLRR